MYITSLLSRGYKKMNSSKFVASEYYFLFFKSWNRFIKSSKSMSSFSGGFVGVSLSFGTAGKSGSWKSFVGILDRGCGFGVSSDCTTKNM